MIAQRRIMLTQEQGQFLVDLARKNIVHFLKVGQVLPVDDVPPICKEKRGVFVTLKKNGHLRGCIGYPEPVYPLLDALLDSSVSAAVRDPRFPPVTSSEMDSITVEVTVLKVGFALLFMSFFCVCGLLARIIAELEASKRSGESAHPSNRT